jgi:hypothetical protein
MKLNDDDKRLVELARKLESPKCKKDLLLYAEGMVRAQEALKADYGLVGQDAPLFNGAGAVPA